jgi:hypothetical protein
VCINFTLAFSTRGLADPGAVFHAIEQALRQVILDRGRSLSHPHGVGKVRQRFLPQVHPEAGLELARAVKRAVDPATPSASAKGACGRGPSHLGPVRDGIACEQRARVMLLEWLTPSRAPSASSGSPSAAGATADRRPR